MQKSSVWSRAGDDPFEVVARLQAFLVFCCASTSLETVLQAPGLSGREAKRHRKWPARTSERRVKSCRRFESFISSDDALRCPRGIGTDLAFDEVETLRVMSQAR